MSEKQQNPNRRFIGKVKAQQGKYGSFNKIYVDNPNPNNQDGTPNQYYEGSLIWIDKQTGKRYMVKQLSVRGVPQSALAKGFVQSISIDLDSEYEVQDLG